VRRGIHVLAQDQAVLEREHVDPVPFDPLPAATRRRRRPLADDEAVTGVEAATRELQVRVPLEDPRDVRADRVALDAVAGRVVLEDHPRRVERHDRVDVVRVPGLVVAADRLLERRGSIAWVHPREYRTAPGARAAPGYPIVSGICSHLSSGVEQFMPTYLQLHLALDPAIVYPPSAHESEQRP